MQGFPGTVQVAVTYTLTDSNELITEMHAVTGLVLRWLRWHNFENFGDSNCRSDGENCQVAAAPPLIDACVCATFPHHCPALQTAPLPSTWRSTATSIWRGTMQGGQAS